MKNPKRAWIAYLLGSLGIVLFILIWQIYSLIVASYQFFPSFFDTLIAFFDLVIVGDFQGYTLMEHTISSIGKVVWGFGLALLVGIPIGILMGRWRNLDQLLKPLIEILRPIPPIAWIPLALYLLHAGLTTHVFIIWLGALFPIILNTIDGVRRTDPVFIDVANSFGASQWQILAKVIVPSSLPEIITGARVGLGVGWMTIVAAEMIGVRTGTGLGYLIILLMQRGLIASMIATMVMIGIIGLLMNESFIIIEKLILRYRQDISL